MDVGPVVGSPDVLGARRCRNKPYWGFIYMFIQRGGIVIAGPMPGGPMAPAHCYVCRVVCD